MQDVCAVRPAPTAKAKPITALIGLGFVLALVPRSHGRDAESSAKRNGGTMRHSIKRRVLVGVAGLAGVISTLWLAAPAQAAHRQITQEQVYYDIPDKYTPVPKRTLDGIDFELRAGHFEGSLYGWARINPGSNWNLDYILALNVTENGGTNWWYYEQTWKGENGWNHTRGRIAHAGANTKFRACLIKIDIYAKPDYWICTDPW